MKSRLHPLLLVLSLVAALLAGATTGYLIRPASPAGAATIVVQASQPDADSCIWVEGRKGC